MKPLVSVVVPAYNASRTIAETLESVRAQTFRDFELIVIDDGSADDTAAVVSGVADPRLKLYRYDNGGLPTARNRGIERAEGEYITFIDADDLWSPDKIALQVQALERVPAAGVAYSWTSTIDATGHVVGRPERVWFEGDVYAELLQAFFIACGSNVMIRRAVPESTGLFDPALGAGEDWDFLLRAAARWPFVLVPREQIFYRLSPTSMSSNVDGMCRHILPMVERAFDGAPPALQSLRPIGLATTNLYFARLFLTYRSDREAIEQAGRCLLQAFRLRPRNLLRPTAVRLLIRWLAARLFSPQAAARLTAFYQRRRWRAYGPRRHWAGRR